MKMSESIDQLVTALAKAKLEIGSIGMSGRNPFFTTKANPEGSKYSTYTDLFNGTNQALSKNGLILSQYPYKTDEGRIGVETYIFHNSGQWMSNEGVPLRPDKDTPQGYASALTYSKRQEAFAMLGLSGDPDDDGNEANGNAEPTKKDHKKDSPKVEIANIVPQSVLKIEAQKSETLTFDRHNGKAVTWLKDLMLKKGIDPNDLDYCLDELDGKPILESVLEPFFTELKKKYEGK